VRLFGLIGYPLGHSFSQTYFREKFNREGITDCDYLNFSIADITTFPALLQQHADLAGLNVTIPYKEAVLKYVHQVTPVVEACGAANCLDIRNGRIMAYNTDVIGFERSLKPLLQPHHQKALVLGWGGAAKAVVYVLRKLGIGYTVVSRKANAGSDIITYQSLNKAVLAENTVIINTTPLGLSPNENACADIPYQYLGSRHLLYDLIYKPATTLFLQKGLQQGCVVKNGHEMLLLQAEAAWDVWNTGT
jgi:shikimate dehydrogenase